MIALALLMAAQAPALEKLTIDEAIARALKNNPAVDAARLNALAANQTPIQVRSALLPQLNGVMSGAGAPDETRIGAGGLNNPRILSRLGMGVTINQLVLDFGRTARLSESAGLRAQAEGEAARGTRGQAVLQVSAAYLAVLRAQTVERVAARTVEARRTVLDQVSALASSKLKSELDVRFAEVSLAEAELLVATARNERDAARADLSAAMGMRGPAAFELVEPPPPVAPSADLPALIDMAAARNPEIGQRRHLLDAALRQAEAERLARLPSISAIASAGVVPAHTDRFVRDTYAAAGVNVTLPLFTGRNLESRRAEARLRAQAAEKTLRDAENRVARNVGVSLLNTRTSLERLELAGRLEERSRQALELSQLRYDLGLSSIVELTQSQLALVNAEIQMAAARYDLLLQQAILDFHLGSIQ